MIRASSITLCLAVTLSAACGDQGPDAVPGTYLLETVDGKGTPFQELVSYVDALIDGQPVLVEDVREFISDTLRLEPGGALRETSVWRRTTRAVNQTGELVADSTWMDALTVTGTYVAAGRTVDVTYSTGRTASGTVNGDILELVNAAGSRARFRRRG
jgi:hypothetical protein